MNTERASYFTERSYTTSEAENKKDIFEYWKKILGEDTLRVAEKCYGIDLVKVLNSENYVCENNHVMSEMEKVKIELFEKPINYNYSGFKGEKLAFDNFFIPLINYGIDILKNGTSLFWTDSIIDTYANTLLERLGKISLGILMFEMYLCKKTGKLNGRNSEEEYDYYNNNFLSKKSYKQELFNIYPCLLRSVTETVENLSSYYVLLLERLNKDKNEIANKFCGGLEFKNVVEISSNISDSHKKGNGVSILKLDNGTKIVYKPRSLKIEKVYFDFLGKINAGCKYEMYEPKILDCQEYGWEEFVYYKSCKTEDEIRRYFYRFGILIFGSYILNTNDLHEENVIAAGEYPIIIDAETILDNRRRGRTNSAKEEINYILHESVLYSGLLPHYRFSNLGQGVDMSAIKGSEGKEYPIVIPKIADLCTSNMRFVYEHPTTGVNQNLVKLDGENVSAFHYLKEINAGFEDAYKYVLENKEKFLEYADMFGNLNIRHLVQDTQRYSMLLHTSFHPDFMQDGRDRQMFLCSLFKQYEATQGDNSFDLVYGNAGAVITLINMYQLTGNKEYIASAEIAGDIIVNAQEKEGSIKGGWNGDGRTSPLAGFSHGASGIVLALAKLWQVTQKEEYLLSLLDGIKFENSLFVKEKGNWKDERVYAGEKASDGGSFTVAWCHGAAGILLSRSKVNVILNGRYSDLIENDIKVAVNTILKEGILGNNCLCHGNLGNTEILFEYLKDHSDKKIEKYYVDIRDIIAENVCNGVFDCDNAYLYGYKLQGFMTGLCGMGYSLLRDIKKDLPCVIALEV